MDKPQILYCKYCGKECKNLNSLKQHEVRCKMNPNKIDISNSSNNIIKYNSEVSLGIRNGSNKYIKAKQLGLEKPSISEETRIKLSQKSKGKILSPEVKEKISKIMKEKTKENPEHYCGCNYNGRVKKYKCNGFSLDGTWELSVANYLNLNNIEWLRPRIPFEYEWKNSIHLYYPDFYLPKYNIYIEVKGYEKERDIIKYKTIEKLIIIRKKEIDKIKQGDFNIFDYIL